MGFPSPALDYREPRISLDDTIIAHPTATYFMEMESTALLNAFIPPKALLVVDRSLTAQNGDIVIAVVNGEFIARYLQKNDVRVWLRPANSKFADILVTADLDLVIWGVVIRAVINPKELGYVCTR